MKTIGNRIHLLKEALNKLPNLHTIEVQPLAMARIMLNPQEDGPRIPGSTTTLFSAVLNAIALSCVMLKALIMIKNGVGAPEYAFDLPATHMKRLASLEIVELHCTRQDDDDPSSRGMLSNFLGSLPALKKLHVGSDSKRLILDDLTRLTHPNTSPEEVHLNGIYLNQADLLAAHADTLQSLTLSNCNLAGADNQWRTIFLHFATFPSLRSVDFNQLAQNDMRIHFPSTAAVDEFEIHPSDLDALQYSGRVGNPGAWVYLRITSRYRFAATENEHVPGRLRELAEDVRVMDEAR